MKRRRKNPRQFAPSRAAKPLGENSPSALAEGIVSRIPPSGVSTPGDVLIWRIDWRTLTCCAVLAAAAFAAYSQTFSVPFLADDIPSIPENLTLRHWGTALGPAVNSTATARPILNLSLAINYAISGINVWSYHALNLAIHALAGLALFGIIRRTLLPRSGSAALSIAFSAALLWTLHPLQTESVTYIVQRAESLMGLFYLLTLYFFIRGAETGTGWRRLWYAFSVAACVLGMGTKEVMVSAPLIVLLYDRTFLAGSFREAWLRRRWVHGALFASWILLGYLVVSTGGNRGSISTGLGAGVKWWDWILTQFPAICHYLRLCFWPRPLVFEYGTYWVLRPISVLPQGLAVGLLAGGTLWALWRRPAIGFLGFWFFAILAPTTLVAGTLQMVVEHRMYLALIPVVVLFVLVTYRWMGRGALPFCLLIAAGLFGMTLNRNETYHSAESIWSDTVAKRPENALAHYMLGWYWYHSTPWRLNDAIAQIEEALRLKPDYFEAHMTLGIIRSQMPGRLDEAVSQFEEAVRLRPNLPNPHFNLGVAWLRVPERLSDAIAQFEIALQQKPDFPEAHYFLAVALSRLPGCREQEKAHLNEVLRLKPDDEPARRMLGGISESQR